MKQTAGRPRVGKARKKVPTTVALTPDVRRWLKARAMARGVSFSAALGMVLFEAMARESVQQGRAAA